MMEWRIDTEGGASVFVPEALLFSLVEALGSLSLDPYRDRRFRVARLPEVLDRIGSAIQTRHRLHRRETLDRLNLRTWEDWASGLLRSLEENDGLLALLLELEQLCDRAREEGKAIAVLCD